MKLKLGEALMAGQAGRASNVIGDVVVLVHMQEDRTYLAEVCHNGGWWEEQTFATLDELEAAYPQDDWAPT